MGRILITITEAKGSTPREAGAFMVVDNVSVEGTIGGGQLEWMAIEKARYLLVSGEDHAEMDVPLGPEIGQCCGGRVRLALERLTPERQASLEARLAAEAAANPAVFIFGAGHVGLALALALSPLPLRIRLIDSRNEPDPILPPGIAFCRTALPEAEIAALPAGGAAVIVTHDHAQDFLIGRAALAREDLAYIGMIGSATKRARFASWLREEDRDTVDLDRLILPIGASAVRDKRPAVIAALVAAELLQRLLR
ncbi:xanthine dehydrogenase accessory protein XdhC [Rhizobium paknamense]|uniref:Xanthine dehydrogenase accessory factor n=1 Tax=Rhizobium paknamense TaxID=1206817 RepID=A0ABU0I877_9HYPH|nr:xanthine dehydrogenase accessory protein XdhC [Rhizobium paknamense]MDQ0454425.1 xanthine dehydrogenase accessory factor [Rhizobium paknamense]